MEKQQREQVDRNIREAKEKLEAEMEAARHEHQLMLMRQGKNAFSLRCIIFTFHELCTTTVVAYSEFLIVGMFIDVLATVIFFSN